MWYRYVHYRSFISQGTQLFLYEFGLTMQPTRWGLKILNSVKVRGARLRVSRPPYSHFLLQLTSISLFCEVLKIIVLWVSNIIMYKNFMQQSISNGKFMYWRWLRRNVDSLFCIKKENLYTKAMWIQFTSWRTGPVSWPLHHIKCDSRWLSGKLSSIQI